MMMTEMPPPGGNPGRGWINESPAKRAYEIYNSEQTMLGKRVGTLTTNYDVVQHFTVNQP